MVVAFLLGLTGSIGHCAGMCSGIVLLIERNLGSHKNRRTWLTLHSGRLLSYALLGFGGGYLGQGIRNLTGSLAPIQGTIALFGALIGIYFVLALIGISASPENLFPHAVLAWRRTFQRLIRRQRPHHTLLIGMAWGLLPCGLVYTAIFTAVISTSPLIGALTMLIFGVATLPMLFSVSLLSTRLKVLTWPRYGAAAVLAIFSLQLAMRGMAALGFVDHAMFGKIMLW